MQLADYAGPISGSTLCGASLAFFMSFQSLDYLDCATEPLKPFETIYTYDINCNPQIAYMKTFSLSLSLSLSLSFSLTTYR